MIQETDKTPAELTIAEFHMFGDSKGRTIEQFKPLTQGEPCEYMGTMMLLGEGLGGQVQTPVRFAIKAEGVREAFEKFDQCAEEAAKAAMQEMHKPKIIQPGMSPALMQRMGGNGQ